jgi:hypothetical protein
VAITRGIILLNLLKKMVFSLNVSVQGSCKQMMKKCKMGTRKMRNVK